MIPAHNLAYTKYVKQKLIEGRVWFLVGFTVTAREARRVAQTLRDSKWRPDRKTTKWKARVFPVKDGYLIYRR